MAISKQTKPKAKGQATSSARRTQASSPSDEDPPLQESRRPRTSQAAGGLRNNQAKQQNDDDSQDEQPGDAPWMPGVRAAARAMSTVAEAQHRVETSWDIIMDSLEIQETRSLTNFEKISLATARYDVNISGQRREELKALLGKQSCANDDDDNNNNNNPSYKDKGKGKAAAQSLSTPRSGRSAASAPAAGSGGQDYSEDEDGPDEEDGPTEEEEDSEDEPQQQPLRQTPQNPSGSKPAQSSNTAPTIRKGPPSANPEGHPRSVTKAKTTNQKWNHKPMKFWKIRGIVKESKSHYKIAWKGWTRDDSGQRVEWDDFWVHKSFVNDKAREDWDGRKKTEARWRELDDNSSEDDDEVE